MLAACLAGGCCHIGAALPPPPCPPAALLWREQCAGEAPHAAVPRPATAGRPCLNAAPRHPAMARPHPGQTTVSVRQDSPRSQAACRRSLARTPLGVSGCRAPRALFRPVELRAASRSVGPCHPVLLSGAYSEVAGRAGPVRLCFLCQRSATGTGLTGNRTQGRGAASDCVRPAARRYASVAPSRVRLARSGGRASKGAVPQVTVPWPRVLRQGAICVKSPLPSAREELARIRTLEGTEGTRRTR
mmetsp:Transcript_16705/g.42291  ORF Transcript_16705/g.42291 Transcript_16705/m.42291 type:complete len:245 (-) Transcript_16705:12-746(-)